MYQIHAMHLSLYPPIPYSQASDHSVTVVVVNMMLFIGTPVSATHCRIFIYNCRSCLCQEWRCRGTHLCTLFRRLWSRFRKYLTSGMMRAESLSLPMRDSSFSIFTFVKARDTLMLCTQAFSFYCSRNTRRYWVWMSYPRQVLRLERWPSHTSLLSERGLSRFRGLSDFRGLNMARMINKTAFLEWSIQRGLSMVMVMMSSMNPSIENPFA